MNKQSPKQNLQNAINSSKSHREHKPYWKRIHHTWSFWVFLILMFVAILYYIKSVDFSLAPRPQTEQQSKTK